MKRCRQQGVQPHGSWQGTFASQVLLKGKRRVRRGHRLHLLFRKEASGPPAHRFMGSAPALTAPTHPLSQTELWMLEGGKRKTEPLKQVLGKQ